MATLPYTSSVSAQFGAFRGVCVQEFLPQRMGEIFVLEKLAGLRFRTDNRNRRVPSSFISVTFQEIDNRLSTGVIHWHVYFSERLCVH